MLNALAPAHRLAVEALLEPRTYPAGTLLMREGDHWHIVMPPNLGFGASSAVGGAVPPGQVLVMDLTLVSAVAPRPGETPPQKPFSLWGNAYTQGAAITIRP